MKPSLKKAFKSLPPAVQEAFKEFGRIGGKKGGPKGGKTRAHRMTAEERREAARKAVQMRWAKVKGKKTSKARKPRPQPLLPAPRRSSHTA